MPATTRPPEPTVYAFLLDLDRSGLVERPVLAAFLAGQPDSARERARPLADALLAAGHLTHYQAEKLLLGLWQGLVLGPYRILAPLGRGGMGTVYLARDARVGPSAATPSPGEGPARDPTLAALKVLSPKRAREEGNTLLRFRREMELGRMLSHPNVTCATDSGETDGVHYIAMEYVPGESLRRLVQRRGPLPAAEAAGIFADVAAGLAHAHGRGLIHRDLKPSNVMVMPDGRAKILDLGLALVVGEPLPTDRTIVGGRGYILGTMDYIAPEQAADATDVDPRSDLYSLGCSLYYTLAGVPPFPGGTAQQKIRWQRTEAPPPVRSLNPSIPPAFAALVGRLLEKRPEDRPASAEEVRECLLPWVGTGGPAATAAAAPSSVAAVDTPDYEPGLWEVETGSDCGDPPALGIAGDRRTLPVSLAATPLSIPSHEDAAPHDGESHAAGRWHWFLFLLPPALAALFILLRGR